MNDITILYDMPIHTDREISTNRPVDTVTTNKWLSSNLKGETEGLLVAAQDQAINTRNYQKVICGQQLESKCRMCSRHEETVDHILSRCEVLAKTEYISEQPDLLGSFIGHNSDLEW